MKDTENPKLTIGVPVYNESKLIHKRLTNIFEQTFGDFEIIISDNGSTDNTYMICEEYGRKDNRIKIFRQSKNMGWVWNHKFVAEKAKGKYFVWAAADDIWESDFLEKNIKILDTMKNVVASVSRIERYGPKIEEFESNSNDVIFSRIYKKIRRHFRPFGPYPASGAYAKKIQIYLKKPSALGLYSVFRINVLKNSLVKDRISVWDLAFTLEFLKHGDLHVIDEVLLHRYTKGVSSHGIWDEYIRQKEIRFFEVIFPHLSFTIWCWKNIGKMNYIKNIHNFVWLNCWGPIGIGFNIVIAMKKKLFSK
ncbi:MAG: glycosyltransferase family 2 protein [Thaumarchaeota archaeon]|jgi:glycosyltransferase involved in cell wall biosynthesis|nr:MAG: glycosyltransferase family 2 protein [Nitrososphaerota archaeon]